MVILFDQLDKSDEYIDRVAENGEISSRTQCGLLNTQLFEPGRALDGPLEGFGVRFWRIIGERAPLIVAALQDSRVPIAAKVAVHKLGLVGEPAKSGADDEFST